MYGVCGTWVSTLCTKLGDVYIAVVQVLGAVIGKA